MIKDFTIYGERCSGTNFLYSIFTGDVHHAGVIDPSEAKRNKISNIPWVNTYGWKHFFGFHNTEIQRHGDNTLFLGIVRNPYDWIHSFYGNLYHVPDENRKMYKFLLSEWYSVKKHNVENLHDRDLSNTDKRYKNIFDLRSKKLNYLYNTMPTLAKNYYFLKYEDLCQNPHKIFDEISKKFNLNFENVSKIKVKKPNPHKLDNRMKQIIDDNIDWDMENSVGYEKR
tara:strand:+ start:760 stop:1437 length:678 start_codon:yes stop_codon:yes gene_type:complete